MKKYNLILITILGIISVLMIPVNTFAKNIDLSQYETKGIEEIFEYEGIDYNFSKYDENSGDKITIYMFRGNGCAYCKSFLNYLKDSLLDKYGDKFKIVSFEVWYNSENASLMQEVASFLNDDADGVPYVIIGDKTFVGYSESLNSEIESAITTLYNSSNRYDVFEEMNKTTDDEKTNTSSNTLTIVVCNIIITCIAVAYLVNRNNRIKEDLESQIEDLESMTKKGLKTK